MVANRATKEIESAIGHVMNTVILRIDLFPDMTFKQLLRRVREVNLAAFASQEVPFEYLGDVFDNDKNIDRSPLCQVLVIYNTGMTSVVKLPGLTFASLAIKSIRSETEVALSTFDLIFDLKETSTELTGSVNYKTDLIDNNVLTWMTDVFFSILKKLVRATLRFTESSYENRRLVHQKEVIYGAELCASRGYDRYPQAGMIQRPDAFGRQLWDRAAYLNLIYGRLMNARVCDRTIVEMKSRSSFQSH